MRSCSRPAAFVAMLLAQCHVNGAIAAGESLPTVGADGTIHAPAMQAPLSGFLSPQAKAAMAKQLQNRPDFSASDGIEITRARADQRSKQVLDGWLRVLPVETEDTRISGVHVHVVTPKGGVAEQNRKRVLINAHSGGFMFGGTYGGQIEAVPMAGYGGVKVIAVDYRLAPEHLYPAASEDMEAVYRHVLKDTPAENIGIYGCSAGGTLAAQMVPWLESKGLPLPGAIGLFCSGAVNGFWYGGDAQVTSRLLNAVPPPREQGAGQDQRQPPRDYFAGIDKHTPFISPGEFPDVLARFPPTLVVTGTRDISMSNAIVTHARLLSAGATAELFVQEGLGHGAFAMLPGLPESKAAHDVIWHFFDRHLGK